MQVQIVVELTGDDGGMIGREIIADMTKLTTAAEISVCRSRKAKPCLPDFSRKMQWSRTGAHLLLQTRTQTIDGSLGKAVPALTRRGFVTRGPPAHYSAA